jgi:hypothetical protein
MLEKTLYNVRHITPRKKIIIIMGSWGVGENIRSIIIIIFPSRGKNTNQEDMIV